MQDQLAKHEGALDIEAAEGFVEQQDPFGIQQQQDQRQPFPLRPGERRGLRVERHGQTAEHSRGIRPGIVTDREVETVAHRQPGPEAGFRLRKPHVAPPQGMSSEGDAPRVGDDEPVQRLQQRTPTLARDTVDGIRREVHRHTVEERPLPVANPEGVNRNHKGSG